ncbi:Uu.00g068040.m01.CDS01 [Anthostomella pinea]|uniref:Uu.00g068040.m01.CDS01 n=1 Tax=Anthostomella pinea TaxID=933095 RepID=A0AAI8YNB3_9PEZI|nr:Uu.00g068040.m01.CDS01 [Anthostomella pinea]
MSPRSRVKVLPPAEGFHPTECTSPENGWRSSVSPIPRPQGILTHKTTGYAIQMVDEIYARTGADVPLASALTAALPLAA